MPRYRYVLDRRNPDMQTGPRICWVMLNPSTADDTLDDQTIRKVKTISWREGYAKLVVVNLFAVRTTIPDELPTLDDPWGVGNAAVVREEMRLSCAVVFAWGAWWSAYQRKTWRSGHGLPRLHVEQFARDLGHVPLCLGKTKFGDPKHPCRLANDTPLVPF